jgi:hypothetical protein
MNLNFWTDDKLEKSWNLSKLDYEDPCTGVVTECDPVAARLAVAAKKVFRMRATFPETTLQLRNAQLAKGEVVTIDMMLTYIPLNVTQEPAEQWQLFYDKPGVVNPMRPCGEYFYELLLHLPWSITFALF